MLYWLRSGCAWRLLPHDFPPCTGSLSTWPGNRRQAVRSCGRCPDGAVSRGHCRSPGVRCGRTRSDAGVQKLVGWWPSVTGPTQLDRPPSCEQIVLWRAGCVRRRPARPGYRPGGRPPVVRLGSREGRAQGGAWAGSASLLGCRPGWLASSCRPGAGGPAGTIGDAGCRPRSAQRPIRAVACTTSAAA